MLSKAWKAEKVYINEIIRVTYKCNWKCKFCNVLKTNNYWESDVTDKEIIHQILILIKKYSFEQRKNLILSFSWWEPTLLKNLDKYIKLAKKIWVWTVEIQTNWTNLFNNKELILKYINAWLNEIFLAQHSFDENINKKLWVYYNVENFKSWVKYIKENNIDKKVCIYLNIVITKINIFYVYDFIKNLLEIWFIKIIPIRQVYENKLEDEKYENFHKISFWFVQPNWYANLNKNEVLLTYTNDEILEIKKFVKLCENNNILPDFHFVCPPLCVLNYPEYNLEYSRLKKLENDKKNNIVNEWNLQTYEFLWKEKIKFENCKKCKNNNYCLWFYKNWIDFVWDEYVKDKIENYLNKI